MSMQKIIDKIIVINWCSQDSETGNPAFISNDSMIKLPNFSNFSMPIDLRHDSNLKFAINESRFKCFQPILDQKEKETEHIPYLNGIEPILDFTIVKTKVPHGVVVIPVVITIEMNLDENFEKQHIKNELYYIPAHTASSTEILSTEILKPRLSSRIFGYEAWPICNFGDKKEIGFRSGIIKKKYKKIMTEEMKKSA